MEIRFEGEDTRRLRSRRIDASGLTTAQRLQIEADVNDACFFSSKVSDAKLLESMREYIAKASEGESGFGRADFITKMRRRLGVPEGEMTGRGALTDITSSRRLGLIYDFQKERTSAEQMLAQAEDPDFASLYPALELIREQRRNVPRDWRSRWVEAGGKLSRGGRMVAFRNDPIWRKISRFGSPTPPFDFNSGMGVENVSAREARALGISAPDLPEQKPEKASTQETESVGFERQPEALSATLPKNGQIRSSLMAELKSKFGKRLMTAGDIAVVVPMLESANAALSVDSATQALFKETGAGINDGDELIFKGTEKEKQLARFVLSAPSNAVRRKNGIVAFMRRLSAATLWAAIIPGKRARTVEFWGVKNSD